jgi:hypothetical protein
MLTLGVSVLDGLGYKPDGAGNITVNLFSVFPLYGKKESIELSLRMFITLGGFATIVAYEFFDYILPRRDLDEFRRAYLKQQKNEWREPEGKVGIPKDIRINIMHVRRPWYTLFIGRFYWTWNDGFKPPNQKDSKLLLLTLQGVAGIAYRTQAAKWIDLRGYPPPKVRFADYRKFIAAGMAALLFLSLFWSIVPHIIVLILGTATVILTIWLILRLHPFYLWPRQAKKTEYVKYILSVPIFRASKGENTTYKCAGVINLDTTTEDGAAFLAANRGRLVDHFYEAGLIIACLG